VAQEFRLMTIQRASKQLAHFLIKRLFVVVAPLMNTSFSQPFCIVLQAAEWLDRFPTLRRMLRERTNIN